ncbi:MAG: HNH endonuclease [Citrobacter telavivensis]
MSPYTDKDGYLGLGLVIDGKRKQYKVHRLVAIQFLPNPEDKPQVNHKDGNPANNHKDNLEWTTARENINHKYGHSDYKIRPKVDKREWSREYMRRKRAANKS